MDHILNMNVKAVETIYLMTALEDSMLQKRKQLTQPVQTRTHMIRSRITIFMISICCGQLWV